MQRKALASFFLQPTLPPSPSRQNKPVLDAPRTVVKSMVNRPASPSMSDCAATPRDSHSPAASLGQLEEEQAFKDGDGQRDRPGRMHRSSTFSSMGGFDFQANLLPLMPSGEAGLSVDKGEERHVGLFHAIGLIIGTQVGSGIFSSPGVVVAEVGSAGASLVVWVLSALLAWTGASSYAELGCAIPLSGGAQAYLAYAYGPLLSYLYTWTAVSTIKPGSSAIISLIFAEYVNRMIYHIATGEDATQVPEWSLKVTAAVAITLVAIINLISRSAGTNSSVVFTTVKMLSLLFVGILGIIFLVRNGPNEGISSQAWEGTSRNPSSWAIAIYSGLWAFDGWDACCFVAGEMKNTHRDLPRAINSSMALVLLLFLGANVSYFIVLDPHTVSLTNTVALDFGRVTLGKIGAAVFSVLVSISCFGALNASFYTTAKLIYASSRDHFLPEIFSRLHPKRRTPDHAMALQSGLTMLFVVFGGGFRSLLNFFSVTSWTFYLLTVLGLLVLRVKEPHLERPYRAWITTPIIFCGVAMFLLLMPIFAAPIEAFAACVFMAAGIPMYYLTAESRIPGGSGGEGGIKGTLVGALRRLKEDLANTLPQRFGGAKTGAPPRADDGDREERTGMLRGEVVEMSER